MPDIVFKRKEYVYTHRVQTQARLDALLPAAQDGVSTARL